MTCVIFLRTNKPNSSMSSSGRKDLASWCNAYSSVFQFKLQHGPEQLIFAWLNQRDGHHREISWEESVRSVRGIKEQLGILWCRSASEKCLILCTSCHSGGSFPFLPTGTFNDKRRTKYTDKLAWRFQCRRRTIHFGVHLHWRVKRHFGHSSRLADSCLHLSGEELKRAQVCYTVVILWLRSSLI